MGVGRPIVTRSCVDWRNSMLALDTLMRKTTATSRIRVVQEPNRSSSRGSAVLQKSVKFSSLTAENIKSAQSMGLTEFQPDYCLCPHFFPVRSRDERPVRESRHLSRRRTTHSGHSSYRAIYSPITRAYVRFGGQANHVAHRPQRDSHGTDGLHRPTGNAPCHDPMSEPQSNRTSRSSESTFSMSGS